MKQLITLSGATSVGKTSTLNKLVEAVKDKYNVIDVDYSSEKTKDKIVLLKNIGEKHITIGINTAGDNEECAKKSLELIEKCDIVVCATKASIRTEGGSISIIQDYYKKHISDICLIPLFKLLQQGGENEYDKNDDLMVKILLNQLDMLI